MRLTTKVLAILTSIPSAALAVGQTCDQPISGIDAVTRAVCVSSVLPDQSRFSYGPENLSDGRDDTAWCEGKSGYGEKEQIVVLMRQPNSVRRIWIKPGYMKSESTWRKNSRIKALWIFIRDVETDQQLQILERLDNRMGEQAITMPWSDRTIAVGLQIESVYPGSKYKDTCVSGVRLELRD